MPITSVSSFSLRLQRRKKEHNIVDVERENATLVLLTLVGRHAVNHRDVFVGADLAVEPRALEIVNAQSEGPANLVPSEIRASVVDGD